MDEIAGWIAPAATMIAATMTAANLGARITGWGFAIFTIGSIAWIIVAVASGQSNLLLSNLFLTVVNLFGVWRWLGRRAQVEDAVKAECAPTGAGDANPTLFALTGLAAMQVRDRNGVVVAKTVEAMADGRSGRIDHLIVRIGGLGGVVGANLYRLPWDGIAIEGKDVVTGLDEAGVARLAAVQA